MHDRFLFVGSSEINFKRTDSGLTDRDPLLASKVCQIYCYGFPPFLALCETRHRVRESGSLLDLLVPVMGVTGDVHNGDFPIFSCQPSACSDSAFTSGDCNSDNSSVEIVVS